MGKLPKSERTFVIAVIMVMMAFLGIAKFNSHRYVSSIDIFYEEKEEIPIIISGAVSKPGVHKVFAGMALEQALKKARPKKFANLKNLPLKMIVEEPMELNVEELTEITVHIVGEVKKPLELKVKPGTRISQLKSKLILTNEADKKFFKRQKQLLDGDVISIPKKTVELNSSD